MAKKTVTFYVCRPESRSVYLDEANFGMRAFVERDGRIDEVLSNDGGLAFGFSQSERKRAMEWCKGEPPPPPIINGRFEVATPPQG